jgi:hypothetical protein
MYSPDTLVRIQYASTTSMKSNRTNQRSARPRKLRGKGDYTEEVQAVKNPLSRVEAKLDHLEKQLVRTSKPSIKNAASGVGRVLGNFLGQGDLGAVAGEGLAKLFGHGDYSVKTNSLVDSLTGPTLPKFSNSGRSVRVTEREYLGDITSGTLVSGSTAFSISTYVLNPTNSSTFPWLSNIATLFDQWEPHGIVFEFITTSSEFNGASQALGAVVMATDYDPYDPVYVNKQEMENSDYACSTKPSLNLVHGLECATSERPTKVLYTATSSPSIPLTSVSLGNFNIATQGCSVAGVTLGELWVSYDISFYKKQLNSVADNLPYFGLSASNSSGAVGYFTANTTFTLQSSIITSTPVVGTGSRINFNNSQVGYNYSVTYVQQNSNTLDGTFSLWTSSNGTITNLQAYNNGLGSTGAWSFCHFTFICTGPNASFTTNLKQATGNFVVSITQINSQLTV